MVSLRAASNTQKTSCHPADGTLVSYNRPMSEGAQNLKDPRVVFAGKHRERGPAKYTFTYLDIANAANVSAKTVRNAVARTGGEAELDPRDLESVVRFIVRRRPELLEGQPSRRRRRRG